MKNNEQLTIQEPDKKNQLRSNCCDAPPKNDVTLKSNLSRRLVGTCSYCGTHVGFHKESRDCK